MLHNLVYVSITPPCRLSLLIATQVTCNSLWLCLSTWYDHYYLLSPANLSVSAPQAYLGLPSYSPPLVAWPQHRLSWCFLLFPSPGNHDASLVIPPGNQVMRSPQFVTNCHSTSDLPPARMCCCLWKTFNFNLNRYGLFVVMLIIVINTYSTNSLSHLFARSYMIQYFYTNC